VIGGIEIDQPRMPLQPRHDSEVANRAGDRFEIQRQIEISPVPRQPRRQHIGQPFGQQTEPLAVSFEAILSRVQAVRAKVEVMAETMRRKTRTATRAKPDECGSGKADRSEGFALGTVHSDIKCTVTVIRRWR